MTKETKENKEAFDARFAREMSEGAAIDTGQNHIVARSIKPRGTVFFQRVIGA
jgi:hypothetical protein